MARGLNVCQMAHPATSPAAGGTDANLFYDRFFDGLNVKRFRIEANLNLKSARNPVQGSSLF